MNTPTINSPEPVAKPDIQFAPPKAEKPKGSVWRVLFNILIVIAAAAAGYYGWGWYNNRNSDTTVTSDTTSAASQEATNDPVAAQLRSISDQNDKSTISAEIADTNTKDIATELDNIDAETTGL